MMETLRVKTGRRTQLLDITAEVERLVEASGVESGFATFMCRILRRGWRLMNMRIRMWLRIWRGCSIDWCRTQGLTGMRRGIRIRMPRQLWWGPAR